MATNAEIAAAISSASDLALTPAQMVKLCDRAMAEMIWQGKPQVSYTIQGRTLTFANLQTLKEVREYYISAMSAGGSKYIMQPAEF